MTACGGRGGEIEPPVIPPPLVIDPPPVFTTFQHASAAIGQPDRESGQPNQGTQVSDRGLSFPQGMSLGPNGELLVADSDNNRVLVFPSVPLGSGAAASAVFGQSGFDSSVGEVSLQGLSGPAGVAVGQGKIAIADRFANRVLIYDQIPTGGARPSAAVVIGQPDPASSSSGCAANKLNVPTAVAITPLGRLIVADSGNNRVLVWDAIPSDPANVPAPTLVLGQGDFDHCVSNDDEPQDRAEDIGPDGQPLASARTLSIPVDVWSDDDRLVVVDMLNDRVLIWTDFPQRSFQPANLVLGHSTFTDTSPNSEADGPGSTGPTSRTLNVPGGVHSDGTSLVVADTNNHRVLIWNRFPDTSFTRADVVLGHADFDRRASNDVNADGSADGPTSQVFNLPQRVLLVGDALLVSDREFNRVLIFRR